LSRTRQRISQRKNTFSTKSHRRRGEGARNFGGGVLSLCLTIPLNQEYTRKMFRGRPTLLRGAEGVQSLASRWKLSTKSIESKYTKFQVCIIECTVEAEISSTITLVCQFSQSSSKGISIHLLAALWSSLSSGHLHPFHAKRLAILSPSSHHFHPRYFKSHFLRLPRITSQYKKLRTYFITLWSSQTMVRSITFGPLGTH